MTDLPPPDLLDSTGRMRRIVISLLIGAAAALAAFYICDSLAKPDEMAGGFDAGHKARGYQFVFYVTGLAGAVAFSLSLVIQNHFANKKYNDELVARASVRRG